MSADGEAIYEVARKLEVASNSVRRWRRRFESEGVNAIGVIAPGRGRSSWLREGTVAEVALLTMNELPDDGSTRWSLRTLAKPRTPARRRFLRSRKSCIANTQIEVDARPLDN
jgi:transposase